MYVYGGHITVGQSNFINEVNRDLYTYHFSNYHSDLSLSLIIKKGSNEWELVDTKIPPKTEHKSVVYKHLILFVVWSFYFFFIDGLRVDTLETNTRIPCINLI
jgi:hypothetical protein